MSIGTKSKWYYGHTVDETNFSLDFDEGGGELRASLEVNDYTLEELAAEIARAMTEAGGQDYSTSVNRTTRKITISASSNFSLLVSSGSRTGTSVFPLAGFTGSDRTGSSSYEGDSASGKEYKPQLVLYDYTPFDDGLEKIDPTVNESASGEIESVSFGNRKLMECNIRFVTDIQNASDQHDNDANARANLRDFLKFAVTKAKMEFMEDRNNPGSFDKVLLESTSEERSGTGFRIEKMLDEGIPGFYESGDLTFRKVE